MIDGSEKMTQGVVFPGHCESSRMRRFRTRMLRICRCLMPAAVAFTCLAPAISAEEATPASATAAASPQVPATPTPGAAAAPDAKTMAAFLDRLMLVESGGRDDARNPRSTAVGPYQFLESTFLDLARRHFASETATLPPAQILALRTNRPFALSPDAQPRPSRVTMRISSPTTPSPPHLPTSDCRFWSVPTRPFAC